MQHQYTKNHSDPQEKHKESTGGFMYEQPDNPLCLVWSIDKYVSHLPPEATAFYFHPKWKVICGVCDVW